MNLPNALTLLRIAFTGVFTACYLSGRIVLSAVAFFLACISDVLDGYLARKWNQVTNFGKLADPLADKFMILSALFCLGIRGMAPMLFFWLMLVKELLQVLLGCGLLMKQVVVYSQFFGKAASTCLNAGIALSFVPGLNVIVLPVLVLGLVFSGAAVVQYYFTFFRIE